MEMGASRIVELLRRASANIYVISLTVLALSMLIGVAVPLLLGGPSVRALATRPATASGGEGAAIPTPPPGPIPASTWARPPPPPLAPTQITSRLAPPTVAPPPNRTVTPTTSPPTLAPTVARLPASAPAQPSVDRVRWPLTVQILTPTNGERVDARIVVRGKRGGIQGPDEHLWLLVRERGTELWRPYPRPLEAGDDGAWEARDVEIDGPSSSQHDLVVGVADAAGHRAIIRHIDDRPTRPLDAGLPGGFRPLARVTLLRVGA